MLAIEWFQRNYLKLIEVNFHFLLLGYKHQIILQILDIGK